MGQRYLYPLSDLVLEVDSAEPKTRDDLDRLLHELSWVRTWDSWDSNSKRRLYLWVTLNSPECKIPQNCREVLRADAFGGYKLGDEFYLTDGSSLFHLQPLHGEGHAHLAASFFTKPLLAQANFWCFGLMKLLRPLGIYSLHAAGLVAPDGSGVLIVGASGSGKSTITIGLIRAGWRYLADDAVLLRYGRQGVEALVCRRSFYIDAARSSEYADFFLGEETPDANGGRRRRVSIHDAYPEQYVSRCLPRVLIFPQITCSQQSTLKRVERIRALGILLAQSAPQLFDRSTMAGHLELLKNLLQQTETYELKAGNDLYHQPAKLIHLLREARGDGNCRELSSS